MSINDLVKLVLHPEKKQIKQDDLPVFCANDLISESSNTWNTVALQLAAASEKHLSHQSADFHVILNLNPNTQIDSSKNLTNDWNTRALSQATAMRLP